VIKPPQTHEIHDSERISLSQAKSVIRLVQLAFFCLRTFTVTAAELTVSSESRLRGELQSTLNRLIGTNATLPAASLYVEIGNARFSWSGAVGWQDRARKTPLKPENPVRIASNTKTFVAVAILRLWEQGRLDLDAPVSKVLSKQSIHILKEGGYQPGSITIRQLLTHTSGLYDFSQSDEFNKACELDPSHRWTRQEQLQGAMKWGHPYGPPGKVFSYSDTGYIVLGEILENQTKTPMANALRHLVSYGTLDLKSTWLESLEPEPPGVLPRAHQYDGDHDTYADDPSSDLYGGGGLVSTPSDLARFMRAIFIGKVFAKQSTMETMLTTLPVSAVGPAAYGNIQIPGIYRMGVFVKNIEGVVVYEHTGYWGTLAAYAPSLDLAVGGTLNQQKCHGELLPLLKDVIHIVIAEVRTP
jgi:D-alanyl-D-alanine carboxypeptidase